MELSYSLPTGISDGTNKIREIDFLKSNGVAESIYTNKSANKPFSWIGEVITVSCKSIGVRDVGIAARKEYVDSKRVSIPQIVSRIPANDASTLLIIIHRMLWNNLIPKQPNQCVGCGDNLMIDIDMNDIEFSPEDLIAIDKIKDSQTINADLVDGWDFTALGKGDKKLHAEFDGINFNRFVFRIPTLGDQIKNEKFWRDSIEFWRFMAMDCLVAIQAVTKIPGTDTDGNETYTEEITAELPIEVKNQVGMKIFNEFLSGKDLKIIRGSIKDLPVLLFAYFQECPCARKMQIPVSAGAESFFSE